MSIRKTTANAPAQKTDQKPAHGSAEARKKNAKSLLVKIGIGAGIAALGAATGGTAIVAKVGAKVLAKVGPKLAGAVGKAAAHIPGPVGKFLASKSGTIAATGSTATAGTALASSLGTARMTKDVVDVVEGTSK